MHLRKIIYGSCALLVLCAGAFAQTVASSLIGVVEDPANAVVPSATVTLTEAESGAVRTASTDTTGVFRFLNIAPGTYSIKVTVTGFKTLTQTQIIVNANETRDIGRVT